MKEWFYIDVTTTCRERIAVKAKDEMAAKDIAGALADSGVVGFTDAILSAYGSVGDSITVVGRESGQPPKAMRRFDGLREVSK